ncbi:MAG: hypothetical protein HZA83_02830 [Thaumarchaeota archaeon]|nr:hypothetical protein [Nitrososphaerota archaeon]
MKMHKLIVLLFLLSGLFTLTATSQISQVTNTIGVEELQVCTTSSYDEIQPVFGNCIHYHNYTSCLNTSGANTACSLQQTQRNFTCKTGQLTITRNTTKCKPLNKFVVSINKGAIAEKKEIDFSSWGVCVNATENGCLAITCGTLQGGSARNGVFNGCDGGKSCQKFLFCQDGINILQKASRNNFVEYDPTYHLPELVIREVGK